MAEVASAYISLLPSMAGFGQKLDRQISPQLDAAGKKGGSRFAAGLKAAVGPALALVGTAAATSFLKDSIGEAREAQKVGALTTNVIKTTGGAAKISAKEVGDLATAISMKTGIDDEAVQSGSNLLLTFTGITRAGKGLNDVFGRATAAAVDLSASGFGDINSASKQLGKALNDPVKGITALSKSGVQFTDQQKAQIKTLVASGKTLDAQKIILAGVEEQVKGSAAAMSTDGEKASIAFGNLKEDIGTALLPVVDRFASTVTTKVIPAISNFIAGMQSGSGAGGQLVASVKTAGSVLSTVFGFIKAIAPTIAAFAGTIAVVAAGVKIWTTAQVALNIAMTANPIGLLVVAIAALIAGVVYAYTHFQQFRTVVDSAFASVRQAASVAMPYVRAIVQGVVDQLLGIVKVFRSAFTGDWKGVWEGVKQILRGALTVVKTVAKAQLDAVVALIRAIGPSILSAAIGGFGKLKDGAVAGGRATLSYVKSLPGKIVDAFSHLGGDMLAVGKGVVTGIASGIRDSAGSILTAIKTYVTDKVPGWAKKFLGINSPSTVMRDEVGIHISTGIVAGITAGEPAVKRATTRLAANLVKGLSGGTSGLDAYLKGVTKKITDSLELRKTRPGMSKKERRQVADYNDAARKAIKTQKAAVDQLEKSLSRLSGRIDQTKANLKSLQDARASLADQTASSISGELDLTATGGKKLSFATVAANVSGLATRAKAFAGKLRSLLKAGIPAGLVQEVASLGTVQGSSVADALLTGSKQQIGKLASDYQGVDTYSKQIGDIVAGSMYDAGIAAQQGILKGLLDDKAIQRSADQLAKKLTKAVKKSLGIKSPSKVFQNEVGRFIPAGISAGIEDGRAALDRQVAGLVQVSKIGKVQPGDFGGGVAASAGTKVEQHIYPQPAQSEQQIGDAAANRLMFAMSR